MESENQGIARAAQSLVRSVRAGTLMTPAALRLLRPTWPRGAFDALAARGLHGTEEPAVSAPSGCSLPIDGKVVEAHNGRLGTIGASNQP